jgi:hypothetical protein
VQFDDVLTVFCARGQVVISTLAIIAQLLVFLSDELNIQLPNTVLPFETPEAALIAPHYNQS